MLSNKKFVFVLVFIFACTLVMPFSLFASTGLEDEIVKAKVVESVTLEAAATPRVKIGFGKQAAGDIVITESKESALKDDTLELVLPTNRYIEFDGTPKVEVIAGDLEIGRVDVVDDYKLTIDIEDQSDEASTIKISNILYKLNRAVPEGDIEVSVQGPAVVTTYGKDYDGDGKQDFSTKEAATVVNAICSTPASFDEKISTSITLGDNGSYISDDRIMVQLRHAATALGVDDQKIFWDATTKSATFIKGDRVVQLTIGDPQIKVSGVAIPTDKGIEIKDGRTYVSLSAAAVALGATAQWDNDTKIAVLTIE